MFGRSETVHVTTKAEFDAAVASKKTGQIVVEGGDELLSYAAKVAGNTNELQIDRVETSEMRAAGTNHPRVYVEEEHTVSVKVEDIDHFNYAPHNSTSTRRPPLDAPRPATPPLPSAPAVHSRSATRRRKVMVTAGAFIVVVGGVIGLVALDRPQPTSPNAPPRDVTLAPSPPPQQPADVTNSGRPGQATPIKPVPPPASSVAPAPEVTVAPSPAASASTWAWPIVALTAIIALVVVAWRAIGAGANVEVSWKVTEKVEGKLIISKVVTPARGNAKRAA